MGIADGVHLPICARKVLLISLTGLTARAQAPASGGHDNLNMSCLRRGSVCPRVQYLKHTKPAFNKQRSQPHDICWFHTQGPEPSSSCSFAGLNAGCKYMLRVRAHNQAGAGPYSRVSTFKTASSVPYAPGPPREAGSNSDTLLLEWDAPFHDGGSEVLSYGIQLRQGEPLGALIQVYGSPYSS